MSEANVIFFLDSTYKTVIQCRKRDKMKDICLKYSSKIKTHINSLLFLYGGEKINLDLTFEEIASFNDKIKNEMIILAYKSDDFELICPKCGEKIELNKQKIDEIIKINDNIQDRINGVKYNLENIIKNSLINEMTTQLKNINIILSNINEEINKNKEKINNLVNNLFKNVEIQKNFITGVLVINRNEINKNIILFNTDINNDIDTYINDEKIKIIKDNNRWMNKFLKE